MDKATAIKKAGTGVKLAKLLKITPQAVSAWGADLPPLQVYRLRELRPHWFRKARK